MTISTTTRKSLWAKSGNRCAICRLELVQTEAENDNLIIGQECHIISSKLNGPRGKEQLFCKNRDDDDNLLLLCANDHKRIDSLVQTYTVDKLRHLKRSHEEWVKTTLSRDPVTFTNDKLKISSLKKITKGSELLNIIDGAQAFMFENENLTSQNEVKVIPPLLDYLREYGDYYDSLNFEEKAQRNLFLNEKLLEIKDLGFQPYGHSRKINLADKENNNLGRWKLATIIIVRNNNPGIVGDFLITNSPDLEFTF